MSGLWQSVATENLNKGISIGRNEGISIGEKKGRQEGQNDLLMRLIANGEITAAQAAKYQVVN